MKRIILVAALLLGSGMAAHADMNHFTNMLKQPRSDDVLHADAEYCRERTGPDYDGVPVSAAYKRCMRSRGWRYDGTTFDQTWINSDGLTCRSPDGFGEVCTNF
jgi:hypothetical protein